MNITLNQAENNRTAKIFSLRFFFWKIVALFAVFMVFASDHVNAGSPAVSLVSPSAGTVGVVESDTLIEKIKRLERALEARIGIAVYDRQSGRSWLYRADERFPLCSTFKTLVCASLLHRIDAGKETLERMISFTPDTVVSYSPVTEKRTGAPGMSLDALCAATMKISDNTAANLILDAVGGPASLTAFIRMTGDEITRLDRCETGLNEGIPGDERDTTTPAAMAKTIETLLMGEVLKSGSRERLKAWMHANEVAGPLFRSVLPKDWVIADRTGAGGHGTRALNAIIWPPGRRHVVAVVYITETEASMDERNAAIAEIGKELVSIIVSAENR